MKDELISDLGVTKDKLFMSEKAVNVKNYGANVDAWRNKIIAGYQNQKIGFGKEDILRFINIADGISEAALDAGTYDATTGKFK